jgi:cytochrome P450
MQALSKDFLGFVAQMKAQHGDLVYLPLYWEKLYLLNSPELAREALVDHAASLIRHEPTIRVFSSVQGPSVMMAEGEAWQRLHRMLMPAFSPRRVAGYASLMVDAAQPVLDQLVPPGPGASALVDMDELTTRVTMDVICRTLFGQDLGEQAKVLAQASHTLNAIAMRELTLPTLPPDHWPLPYKRRKRNALHQFNTLIDKHIQIRRQSTPATADHGDVLDMLLAIHDEASGQQARLSDEELRAQCKTIFLAGFDTSAKALQWWAWLMAANPEAAARAHAEVQSVVGGRTPTADDAAQMPWLTASIKEALRLYPPAAGLLSRRVTQDIQVGPWHIPKRAIIIVAPWVLHHDARWFPQPQAFKPERFMPDAPALPRGAWMPFGTGPRVCIGQHFAMLEMTLVAAMLLQRYEVHQEPGQAAPEPELNLTLRPRLPLQLRLKRR